MQNFLKLVEQKEKEEKELNEKWAEVNDKIWRRSMELISVDRTLRYHVSNTEFDHEKKVVTVYYDERAGRYQSDPLEKEFSYNEFFHLVKE